ncbi:MAG: TonB-dependent receptor [Bacteroidales bacterium]|nr:TonB-dependent receptor [Bacteroidales bacterium]
MKKIYKLLMMASFFLTAAGLFAQGTTTAGLNGKVTDNNGATLTGATILAVETGTGAQYGTISDDKGLFRLPNMNPGGPYKLTVTFVGFQSFTQPDIYLNLGQTLKLDVKLSESATTLKDVEILGVQNDIFDGNRTGTQTNISNESMSRMPTLGRNITDFTRLTPQAKVTTNGGLEVGGMNNRYNAIFIDGAVNNDVYGLAESGTNGGQTGISPFSMDIIDQFTISIAPYDIKQGGFAGAGINAVTRRGTNEFSGSAYYYMRNEGLAGKTPTDNLDLEREKLANFSSNTYGFRLGGPIIKDKLFFFANVEIQQDETPQPFDFTTYGGDVTTEELNGLTDFVKNNYGYDPGSYTGGERTLDGLKLFARIDWNISQKHKLTLRHQYTKAEQVTPGAPSSTNVYYSNAGIDFPSKTNSTALELKSIFSNKYSNDLIIGLTFVVDDRDPMEANFPYVRIKDGTRNIYFGSEEFSTANYLSQDIITLTDNFEIYKGKHTFTIGTHNEFYKMYNLFVRQNFGSYQYDNLAAFINGDLAFQYDRTFSAVDDVTGDGSKAAADFNAMQIGVYGQWETEWSDKFNTTIGLRLDVPMFLDQSPVNEDFNTNMIPLIEEAGYDLMGAKTGQMPSPKLMFSPRVGFNWDVNGDKKTQVRGGAGIFTSRIPFVWPGGSYTNNGVTTGGMRVTLDPENPDSTVLLFNPDWENQPSVPPTAPSGQVDLFAKNFKFPQVLRGSLAIDQKLPWGIVGTLEVTYTKTLNNVLYYNYRYMQSGNLTGTGDDRPLYTKVNIGSAKYTDFIFGTNTNKGYSYNFTAQLQKDDFHGLSAFLAYTYGHTKSMNDGISSQNSSQWRVPNVRGKNDIDLAISDFDLGSRVVAFLSYKVEYAKFLGTTIGLYYNGQSGQRYAYGYADGSTKFLGEDNQSLELMYVPVDQTDINLIDKMDSEGNITLSAAQQWDDLNAFIEGDDYLSTRRGEYAERNSSRAPFQNIIDLHFAQDFYINVKDKRNTLQFTFDIFNFTNMLNNEWGRMYYVSGYYNNYPLVKFEGFQEDGTTPNFSFTKPKGEIWSIDDAGLMSARWQAQIGIRWLFN